MLFLDYEQSLCFLIVHRERSEKKQAARKLAARKLLSEQKGKKKGLQTKPQRLTTAFVRPTFALPVFFTPLSTDYKKTKRSARSLCFFP